MGGEVGGVVDGGVVEWGGGGGGRGGVVWWGVVGWRGGEAGGPRVWSLSCRKQGT